MQGRKFLFERSDFCKQASTAPFSKRKFGQVRCSNTSMNMLSQFNLPRTQPFHDNANDLFYTPPMEKQDASTPWAPVKLKKRPKKGDLRPKKLQYTEDELVASSISDSGIHIADNTLFCKESTAERNRSDLSQKQPPTLRNKSDRREIQINDKENNENVVEKLLRGQRVRESCVTPDTSVVFNPNAEVLSQYNGTCDNNGIYNWIEMLRWLQPRRDIGLWIECCRNTCKKWRYTDDYHDPVDVPKIWYCEMNSDKSIASCDIPEQSISEDVQADLIENAYNAGSIVWAYIRGYPWWPGIINDCPDTLTYYKLCKNSQKPYGYYVTFFNVGKVESAWVNKKYLKPFVPHKYNEMIRQTKYRGTDYSELLKQSYKLATSALSMTILERLNKYSLLAQLEQLGEINNNSYTPRVESNEINVNSDDDEIPCSDSTQEQVTLKDYYTKVISKRRETQ